MEFDNELQEFNIELLKKICYNGNDFEFVFNNLTTVIKSLNALNKVIIFLLLFLKFCFLYNNSFLFISFNIFLYIFIYILLIIILYISC